MKDAFFQGRVGQDRSTIVDPRDVRGPGSPMVYRFSVRDGRACIAGRIRWDWI